MLETLNKHNANWQHHQGHITAKGLVEAMEKRPGAIHLIEDAEDLLTEKNAPGVLRMALWTQDRSKPPERLVTWTVSKEPITFIFTGAVSLRLQ